jgi:hypothetical protein
MIRPAIAAALLIGLMSSAYSQTETKMKDTTMGASDHPSRTSPQPPGVAKGDSDPAKVSSTNSSDSKSMPPPGSKSKGP